MGPKSDDMSLLEAEGEKTHTEGGHVKTEAKVGIILPKARECLESPDFGNGKQEFSP